MELKLIFRRFWLMIIFMAVGFYDFYENGSISSLIGAILLLTFFIILNRTNQISQRVLGGFLIAISIWGIMDILFLRDELSIEKIVFRIALLVLGLVLILNKFDKLIENIERNKAYQIVLVTALIGFLYFSILSQKDLDVIEILILVAALILGVTVLVPEKKKN